MTAEQIAAGLTRERNRLLQAAALSSPAHINRRLGGLEVRRILQEIPDAQ